MKLDTREMRRAFNRLDSQVKTDKRDLVRAAARGFIRDIVSITPPGSPSAKGSAAKKAGETSIRGDIAKILVSAARGFHGPFEDPRAVHKRGRNPRTGRVDRRIRAARGSKVAVEPAALR